MKKAKQNRVWVWSSTRQSVLRRQISVLAVAESLFAGALFTLYFFGVLGDVGAWLAQKLPFLGEAGNVLLAGLQKFWAQITLSDAASLQDPKLASLAEDMRRLGVFFASLFAFLPEGWGRYSPVLMLPILMLRSPRAVALGRKWFDNYYKAFVAPNFPEWQAWVRAGVIFAFIFAVFYFPLTKGLGRDPQAFAAVAFAGAGAVAAAAAAAVVVAFAVAVAVVAFAFAFAVVAFAFAVAVAAFAFGAGAVAAAVPFILLYFVPTLLIRVAASVRFLPLGLKSIPQNWVDNMLVVDMRHPPELLPKTKQKVATLRGNLDELAAEFNTATITRPTLPEAAKGWALIIYGIKISRYFIAKPIINLIFSFFKYSPILFFLPAYLYRLMLKASCFFYLPLLFLVDPHKILGDLTRSALPPEPRGFWRVGAVYNALWFILAFVTIFFTCLQILFKDYKKILENYFLGHIISALDLVVIIDWNNLQWWKMFALLSAVFTLFRLYFHARIRALIANADDGAIHVLYREQYIAEANSWMWASIYCWRFQWGFFLLAQWVYFAYHAFSLPR